MRLASTLLSGPARELLAQAYASHRDGTPRLCLHFRPDDARQRALLALPWETLYDEHLGGFLDDWLAIVRRVPATGTPKAKLTPDEPPLRVVAALSNPAGTKPLDLNAERSALARAGRAFASRRLEVLQVPAPVTLQSIEDALQAAGARVFHFGGHGPKPSGGADTLLTIASPAGGPQCITGVALGARLAGHGVPLAVLDGCDTLTSARPTAPALTLQPVLDLLAAGLSAVVTMQAPVSDSAVVVFAEEFYRQLADGRDVTQATWAARRAWRQVDVAQVGWAAAVLIVAGEDGALLPTRERAWWAHPVALMTLLAAETGLVVFALERLGNPTWRGSPWLNLIPPLACGSLLAWAYPYRERALRALGPSATFQRLAAALWAAACVATLALLARGLITLAR